MKILISTGNQGKFTEIKEYFNTHLPNIDIEFVSLSNLEKNYEVPEETEDTIEGNAELKAKYYAEKTGMITLADDSGLFIDNLDGWPGVITARIAETDEDRRAVVRKKVRKLIDDKRGAEFRTALALYDPRNDGCHIETGIRKGKILLEDRQGSENTWGYNRMFLLEDLGKTFGELTREEKSKTDHRGKALELMCTFLKNKYSEVKILKK